VHPSAASCAQPEAHASADGGGIAASFVAGGGGCGDGGHAWTAAASAKNTITTGADVWIGNRPMLRLG